MLYTIGNKVLTRIYGHGRGWSFTPKDFLDLGSRAAIDQTLSRLTRKGVIRRVAHGVYDYPRVSPRLGRLSPDIQSVAKAVSRKTGARLQVTGAQALNALGLSNQVPAAIAFLTDGPSRRYRIGKQIIDFHHTSPRRLDGAGKPWSVAAQALWSLGKDGIDQNAIHYLRKKLLPLDKKGLLKAPVPAWLDSAVKQIATGT